jgi:hypothetical protein
MKVHTYEKAFLSVGAGLLVLCAIALVFASLVHGFMLPGRGSKAGTSERAARCAQAVRHSRVNRFAAPPAAGSQR